MFKRHVMKRVAGSAMTRRRLLAIAAFLYPVMGMMTAASAGLFSDDEARKAVSDLRAEVLQLRTAQDARFARIEGSLDALQKSVDRLDQTVKAVVTLQTQLDGLGADLATLRGTVEVQTNAVAQTEKRGKELYLDLDNRLKALEQSLAEINARLMKAPESPKEEAKPEEPKPVAADDAKVYAAATPSAAEQKAYDQVLVLFKAANYVGSVKGFQGFLKSYPGGALESNAEFWLGVSHYRLKAYSAAETVLKTLIKKHPEAPKAPDAYYNLASVQLDAGNAQAAHDTLDELISRYPSSEAAQKAKARLGRK